MVSAEAIAFDVKRRCVMREVARRARVFPKLVAAGRMSADVAEWELQVMREVLEDYGAPRPVSPEISTPD